jgi:hypothetical protein
MFNGQNDHFDHDHNTILSSNGHGQMVKINRYFNNFNKFQQLINKKSWIVEMAMIKFGLTMIKFGLTILTIKPLFGQMV